MAGALLTALAALAAAFTMGYASGLEEAPRVRERLLAGNTPEDPTAYLSPTAELVELGRRTFAMNCVSCHGTEGKGDGPAGRQLAIPPRNFGGPREAWRNGPEVASIVGTLTRGLNNMPPFPGLSLKEKHALAHYLRTRFVGIAQPEAADGP